MSLTFLLCKISQSAKSLAGTQMRSEERRASALCLLWAPQTHRGPGALSADPDGWIAKQATRDRSPPLEISRKEEKDYCLEMTELWVSWGRGGVAQDQHS